MAIAEVETNFVNRNDGNVSTKVVNGATICGNDISEVGITYGILISAKPINEDDEDSNDKDVAVPQSNYVKEDDVFHISFIHWGCKDDVEEISTNNVVIHKRDENVKDKIEAANMSGGVNVYENYDTEAYKGVTESKQDIIRDEVANNNDKKRFFLNKIRNIGIRTAATLKHNNKFLW